MLIHICVAPQEKGYFVLNDIFQFVHEEVVHPNLVPVTSEKIDSQPHVSASFAEPPDYGFEEEAREYSVAQTTRRFLQLETDFEMALDPSRVLYDMDSEDEQWFSNIRNSEMYNGDLNGITEEMFEKTMDLLEKAAFAKLRDQFTPNEIEELMLNVGPLCIVKIIYDHWHQRRQKKGMALIRHFQPPMWERYQQQLKEWEVAVTKNNLSSNGCQDKGATLEKPPMFAFCLKPRGLELQNKGLKHRSQKKISVSGHTNNFRYHDGFHTTGRRPNGLAFSDERNLTKASPRNLGHLYIIMIHGCQLLTVRECQCQHQQLQEDFESEVVVEETPAQEASPQVYSVAQTIRETPVAHVEESYEEPAKKTYASIVCTTGSYLFCSLENFFCLF
ncbi:unnamed protein product [Trifolium pratense]|uniref:Uncharacterized protein n=1 Tax=Trifolium pratense TaxID=57577 RepID=A0ACB0L2I4_TRIPR|nr:unnamed protein product [Trifolium pratense]